MKKNLLLSFALLISASIANAQSALPFYDNFESGGGTLNLSVWDTSNIGINPVIGVASIPFNGGQYGVRMGKSTDNTGVFTTNHLDLPLDLTGKTHVNLEFYIQSYADENHFEDALYFSTDGGVNFTRVFDLIPQSWCSGYGHFPPIHIEKLAAKFNLTNWNTNQFVLRFQHYDDADFNNTNDEDGFYIDEVKVYEPGLTYATPYFFDDFETGSFGSAWTWEFGDSTTISANSNVTRINQIVEITPAIGYNSNYGVRLGRTCDQAVGEETTSALDLHLNLSGLSKVDLSFNIESYADETHINDGIYFSDNAGISFTKVFDFVPQSWCSGYGQFAPLHIEQLASNAGLQLTDSFIVRFQQFDNSDFNNTNDEDGYYLDNVKVHVPTTTYASIPFQDDFETGVFGNAWSWESGDSTCFIYTNVNRINSIVDVSNASGVAHAGSYGVRMGKTCEQGVGQETASTLDLHLQMSNIVQSFLSFYIKDIGTEDYTPSGLWFSDNGGISFIKGYDFDCAALPNSWTYMNINLDSLISSIPTLQKTNNFIVRFQEFDNADFNSTNDEDGFYIVDINISGTVSINEYNSSQEFSMFPNPAKDDLTISLKENTANARLRISNVIGENLYEQNISNQRNLNFDVSKLPQGVYFVTVENSLGRTTKKFIKE